MNDNNNNDEDEKTLKRKKIRRILLLKTDEELKSISKRHSDIMINSKTIVELNKKYNLYNILLSEKSKIYYNFVKTGEKIVSNNIRQINSERITNREKKIEKPNKIINNSFDEDSNSPILNFLPKKINLGLKKFKMPKISSKNHNIFENHFISEKSASNEDKVNKSTKVEKKGLFKLVDKIVNIKMNEDTEETIKKNILRLRKYCNKLRKPKKRIKKLNKQRTQITPKSPKNRDKNDKKGSNRKRMTITDNKILLKRKSLFENNNQEKKLDFKIKRVKSRINTTKDLNIQIKELDTHKENVKDNIKDSIKDNIKEKENIKVSIKEIIKEKEKGKIKRMTSSKVITKMNYINKEKNLEQPIPNKRKIRKMQTLTGNLKNQILELSKVKALKINKNSEINKNDESVPLGNKNTNINTKNHILSSKFERPPKYQFNNSTIKLILNKEKEKSRFNPMADKSMKNSTKEKKEYIQLHINRDKNDKQRHSTKKYKKNSVKIYDKFLHYSKKDDSRFEKKIINFDPNESDIEKMNILSEFNRNSKI